MSRRARLRRRAGGGLAVLGLILLIAVAGAWTYLGPGPSAPTGKATTVILERGSGVRQIGRKLAQAGVIRWSGAFVLAARATGAAGKLKAGEYQVASHASLARILDDIRAGRVVRHLITIPEGWTSAMALEAVNAAPELVGTAAEPAEGSLLPDTYEVQRGDSRADVLARMQKAQTRLLAELWPKRQAGLPLNTPREAVILASIVEKETGVAAERARVAAIFINRLRLGMPLQSDPTIIYGVSKGRPLGRGIRASELAAENPYNSYKAAGLPPTPIANPGRAALEAVLNPAKTDELYFVADGSGGHAFASTYEAHERNVARWREIERRKAAVNGEAK